MKKNNIPGNATPAPAKKAENKQNDKNVILKQNRRMRRMRSLMRLGLSEEKVLEIFNNENVRTILCLYYGSYTIEDGTKKIKKNGKEEEVPNILRGRHAVEKLLENNKITPIGTGAKYCWIRTDTEHVDEICALLKPVGRTSVTAPEPVTKESMEAKLKAERKTKKKPTNNTTEVRAAAKKKRKDENMKKASMRAYYAALRKGGVCERIKKYNKTLADKIEAWLKEHKKQEAKREEADKERRAKHNQLTSLEKKANKHAQIAAKHISTKERVQARQTARMEHNATKQKKRAHGVRKCVQGKLKMAA